MSTPEITLHGTELSGHCHRVELMLRMLGLPYRYVVAPAAARSSPEFHKLNPLRQIPVLQNGDRPRAKQTAAALLNHHLSTRSFLVADHATIADLACYSYVAHAPKGDIALGEYESVLTWLRRVEALPHFKPLPPSPIPALT